MSGKQGRADFSVLPTEDETFDAWFERLRTRIIAMKVRRVPNLRKMEEARRKRYVQPKPS